MKTSTVLSAIVFSLAITVCTSAAYADTREATCDVRKDGDKQQGKSGPCTFGQRQGHIDIDLKNGDTVSLSPANQANHFKDRHGNKVVRTQSSANSQAFRWENGKHVSVTFTASSYNRDGAGSEHPWAEGGGGSHGSHDGSPPEIMVGTNGEGEVIYKNNCVVYFDKRGRRTSNLPACKQGQVDRAIDAMASYRREQGMN
jgi:hypothetical protein